MILEIIKKNFNPTEKQVEILNNLAPFLDDEKCYKIIEELIKLKLDFQTICAFLLDQAVEKTEIEENKIKNTFDEETLELFKNLQIIKSLHTQTRTEEAENLRKMLVAMSKDLRVLIIRLYCLLFELKTYKLPLTNDQRNITIEVRDIFAPLAERLGLNVIKSEMEDECLKLLEPSVYKSLLNNVNLKRDENQKQIEITKAKLENILKELGIKGQIMARQKHFSSVYKKMQSKHLPLAKIYDLIALRVIVDKIEDCYAILGKIHAIYRPMPGRVKDYIANPKANGYQSLHTTVIAENNRPLEIQIRTLEMHKNSEYGVAAHWMYKEKRTKKSSLDSRLSWIREIMEMGKDMSSKDFIQTLKTNLYGGVIFVQTPKGKVLEFPEGATIIDFAYAIHTEVGNTCVGGKINNKIRPLDTKLSNGDIVEILTSASSKGPSRDWLNIVKTADARQKIKLFFKQELKEENIKKGKVILEETIKDKGYTTEKLLQPKFLDEVYYKYSVSNLDELYAAVGYGSLPSKVIVSKLVQEYEKTISKEKEPVEVQQITLRTNKDGILVDGSSGLLIRFAGCCSPVQGDGIVGYISRGKGVTIHRDNCPNLKYLEGERLIQATWDLNSEKPFTATLKINAEDCPNLITQVVKELDIFKVKSMDSHTKGNVSNATIKLEIKKKEDLTALIKKLKQIKGVVDVFR
ncbi:MAG TPA: bifunctional (p)ppGpp synthetase/guanosine-3',5'-bis(diphosphate) 3'-pyrophosphohydrolase [Candidatus Caccopulliclostridium gallistercoris]|uniref:Bifunctional (P)ppGpp synthetase/guanosine-3',5'-bis(Diphosphate) 3'-pyrophosphohydrolase n=1 Tax=Candidatus Caccopulliclostridium gallistercoris TaxID=2840719 RepID=A0A9D1NEH7_9FIRM|nr:bifunctional (p)ppGpp synthetase/guanosine-3',5'-bis(diphosphate) 3'-pyrophosphohydrolase [Candidatus Caccopulliclostridium gallistercoris]